VQPNKYEQKILIEYEIKEPGQQKRAGQFEIEKLFWEMCPDSQKEIICISQGSWFAGYPTKMKVTWEESDIK